MGSGVVQLPSDDRERAARVDQRVYNLLNWRIPAGQPQPRARLDAGGHELVDYLGSVAVGAVHAGPSLTGPLCFGVVDGGGTVPAGQGCEGCRAGLVILDVRELIG